MSRSIFSSNRTNFQLSRPRWPDESHGNERTKVRQVAKIISTWLDESYGPWSEKKLVLRKLSGFDRVPDLFSPEITRTRVEFLWRKSNDEVFSRGVVLTKISSMSKYFEDLSCHSWFTSLLTIHFVCSCFSNLREATACKEINGEKKILFSDFDDCFAFFDCEWN